MARKYQWSAAKYRSILLGEPAAELPGLRSLMHGFDSRDGYNVKAVSEWTPYQRRKVREAFRNVELLQAQPKRIIRARGANLEKLQGAFHGDIPSKNFKVAFIPDTEPKLTLPGAKKRAPKIRILKEGISIQRRNYERIFIPFNSKSLVRNASAEIKRVAAEMPEAQLFFVQVGEYQSVTGKSIGLLTQMVLDWMQKYDGKKALPDSSGNKGDNPKHHHWKYWLNGLIGYKMPKRIDIRKLGKIIEAGRVENEKLTDERKRFMRRKGSKGRGKPSWLKNQRKG
jgi:hypothetical protein